MSEHLKRAPNHKRGRAAATHKMYAHAPLLQVQEHRAQDARNADEERRLDAQDRQLRDRATAVRRAERRVHPPPRRKHHADHERQRDEEQEVRVPPRGAHARERGGAVKVEREESKRGTRAGMAARSTTHAARARTAGTSAKLSADTARYAQLMGTAVALVR